MAKYETVYSSAWVGTESDETLSTRDYEWIKSTQTGRTTIYSALRGLGGNDYLSNTFIYKDMSRENVTIDGGAGNDTIDNRGENPSLVGGAGNDSIRNGSGSSQKANNPTLEGGLGDDTINSDGDNAYIIAGDGNDYIYSQGDKATILGGNDNDNITNYGNNATIDAGDGNDSITHSGDNATIDTGAGDDSIHGYGSDVTIRGGEGADSLNGWGDSSSSIDAKMLLEDTIGNNFFKISFTTEGSVIGGAGDDYIRSDSGNKNLLIDAGEGDNTVSTWYDNNTTIKTYSGNDSISISDSSEMLIDAGEGNNYIGASNINNADAADNTITTGAGSDTVGTSGKRFLILTGEGNDSIKHIGANSTIRGGDGDDYIYNYDGGRDYATNPTIGANNLVEGGAGNDSLSNSCDSVTIDGGLGDDYIDSGAVDKAFLIGGSGNDSIYSRININHELPTNTTIDSGAGDDYIYNVGNQVTIKAGAGNDTIFIATALAGTRPARYEIGGESVLIDYTAGDGKDLIQGFRADSTLSISGGEYSSVVNDNNVVLTVGDDKITLEGIATLETLNIIGTYGGDATVTVPASHSLDNTTSGVYIMGTTSEDSIHNTGGRVTINGLGGNDSIYNTGWDVLDTINDGSEVLIDTVDGDDYIRNNYGDSVTIDASDGNDWINNENSSYTMIKTGAGLDTVGLYNGGYITVDAQDGDKFISSIAYNSSIVSGAGNDSIYYQGNSTTIEAGAGNDTINVGTNDGYRMYLDGGDDDDFIEGLAEGTILGGNGNDTITIKGWNNIITAGAGNDVISLTSSGDVINYAAGDGSDSIVGFNEDSTLSITGGEYSSLISGSNVILGVGEDLITLDGAASLETLNVIGTYSTLTPVTTKGASINNAVNNTLVTGTDYDDTIENSGSNVTIQSFAGNDILTGGKGKNTFVYSGGNDTITDYNKSDKISTASDYENYSVDGKDLVFNFGSDNSLTLENGASKLINLNDNSNYYTADGVLDKRKKSIELLATVEKYTADSKVITIDGSATSAIEITGNKKKNYIVAGATGSTLNGGKGNDTLVGGAGADLFIYDNRTGKDVIFGFGEGDSISLDSSVTIKDAKTKSGDTVLKFKGGGLTVKDTTEFNIGDTLYSGGVFIADDTAKVYGSYRGTINLADYAVANFDGSEGKKKLTIIGTDSANSLVGGKGKDILNGGAGDDYLWGGKGNDTLTGGEGSDTFIYQAGTGKDFITDYAAGDLLQILDKKGDAGDFKKATFKDDTLTLNVKGGGKVLLGGVNNDTSININGTSKTVRNLLG